MAIQFHPHIKFIGYFDYTLDKNKSTRYHMHYNCVGHFTIHCGDRVVTQKFLPALKQHVQKELSNLYYSDSKKTFDHKVREHLDWWQSTYYDFDDFDYSNITCDATLDVKYNCAN